MAAKITFSPQSLSGTITEGGSPSLPSASGIDDLGAPVSVAGPVWTPTLNTSSAGSYVATYTIAQGTDVATEVTKVYTLTVQAAVAAKTGLTAAEFISGSKLRNNTDASGSAYYADEITNKLAGTDTDAAQSAIYDEQGLDPYEVALAT